MQVTPYLHFDGKCEEAIKFYEKTLGAKIECIMHFKDAPVQHDPNQVKPEMMNQVMHSSFKIGTSTIMASDCGKMMQGFSLTLDLKSASEVDRLTETLSKGGTVSQPPSETFFSPRFAVVNDRYGLNWILLVPQMTDQNTTREAGALSSV